MPPSIAPSVLSADFLNLESEVESVRGCSFLHIDIMDGHYVPNITFGPKITQRLGTLGIPLDVHLMIDQPERYVAQFVEAGAYYLTVHPESTIHLHRLVHRIRELGARPGVALNPATPVSCLDYILEDLELVLVMTVNPGFGGQRFLKSQLPKIREIRRRIDALPGRKPLLEVDGGVDPTTAPLVVEAGAELLVAGSAVFSQEDRQEAMAAILNAVV